MEKIRCPEDRFLAFDANLLSCTGCSFRHPWIRVRNARAIGWFWFSLQSTLISWLHCCLFMVLCLFPGTTVRMFVPEKCCPPSAWPSSPTTSFSCQIITSWVTPNSSCVVFTKGPWLIPQSSDCRTVWHVWEGKEPWQSIIRWEKENPVLGCAERIESS